MVIVSFYVLDSKYLQAEKAFRALYDCVRGQEPGSPTSFDLTPNIKGIVPVRELKSWSTYLLYGPILLLLTVLWLSTEWQPLDSVGTNNV